MKTYWFCEDCLTAGAVMHPYDEDIMSVVHLIGDAHNELSPACPVGYLQLRTLNFAEILKASVPEGAIEPLRKVIEYDTA